GDLAPTAGRGLEELEQPARAVGPAVGDEDGIAIGTDGDLVGGREKMSVVERESREGVGGSLTGNVRQARADDNRPIDRADAVALRSGRTGRVQAAVLDLDDGWALIEVADLRARRYHVVAEWHVTNEVGAGDPHSKPIRGNRSPHAIAGVGGG